MAHQGPHTALPSAARAASGAGGGVDRPDSGDTLALLLEVTAVAGTSPTLTVSVEWSMDGTSWAPAETADSFTQVTTAGSKIRTFTVKARPLPGGVGHGRHSAVVHLLCHRLRDDVTPGAVRASDRKGRVPR